MHVIGTYEKITCGANPDCNFHGVEIQLAVVIHHWESVAGATVPVEIVTFHLNLIFIIVHVTPGIPVFVA